MLKGKFNNIQVTARPQRRRLLFDGLNESEKPTVSGIITIRTPPDGQNFCGVGAVPTGVIIVYIMLVVSSVRDANVCFHAVVIAIRLE